MSSPEQGRLWRPETAEKARQTDAEDQAEANGSGHTRRRGTQTGPILREDRWDGKLPRTRAHIAIVVIYKRGDHQVIWPHERNRVLLHRHPTTVYEIDLGLHHTVITANLPSSDHAASFHASISIQWRVLNPSAVVRHQVLSTDETLSAALLHQARVVTRKFRIDQVTEAEDAINESLGGIAIDVAAPAGIEKAMREATDRGSPGAEYGIWTRGITHLTLDEAATQHNIKMMQLIWAIKEEKAEHELRMLKNKNEQEITAERIATYREIVAAGKFEQFALRLASHPDAISDITEIIREDQLTSRHDTIDFIKQMVDSGVVERWEVSDQVKEALEWLKEATARVVTNSDHTEAAAGQAIHQRRRGRGKPIEENPESPASHQIIVVKAEPVQPSQLPEPDENTVHGRQDT